MGPGWPAGAKPCERLEPSGAFLKSIFTGLLDSRLATNFIARYLILGRKGLSLNRAGVERRLRVASMRVKDA